MKDTGYPVRKAYNSLLTGLGFTCFDQKATDRAEKPYIILGSQTSQSEGTKTTFDNRVTISLDIVTSFIDGYGGRKSLDQIMDTILLAAIPLPGQSGVTIAGFNIYSTKKFMDYDFDPLELETQTIYRRIVTIEHLLEQL